MRTAEKIVDGLSFPECPRWHEGELWVSEKRGRRINRITPDGALTVAIETGDEPGGIGWLPDGRLLYVSQLERKVMVWDGSSPSVHADVGALTAGKCNDMVVDSDGRAYVGHIGFDFQNEQPRPASLVLVERDGGARTVAADLMFPNGAEITADGRTLIIAESGTRTLQAFDVDADGSLSERRLWADLSPVGPDGICLDAGGGVWVATPEEGEVIRIVEGGTVTDRVSAGGLAPFACTLGGPNGDQLFMCNDVMDAPMRQDATGQGEIAVAQVDIPAAGID